MQHDLSRRAALGLFGVAGAALLEACGSSSDKKAAASSVADTKSALAITVQTFSPGTASAIRNPVIAQYKLDRKHNLTIKHGGGSSFTSTLDPLIAKVVDASEYGPINTTNRDLEGNDVVIVGPALLNHGRWLVPANSPAKTVADLRGKKVGVQPASSNTYQAAQLAAAVNGIDFAKEFELYPGEPIASLALFERGDLDAIIAIEPNATRVVAKGARQLATVQELWQQGTGQSDPLVLQGIGVRRSWLADPQNHAAAVAWVAVQTEVHQLIHQNPQLLSTYASAYGIPASEKKAIELLPSRLPEIYSTDWSSKSFTNLDKQVEVAKKLGLVKGTAPKPIYETLT